jgi:hypothetical protein
MPPPVVPNGNGAASVPSLPDGPATMPVVVLPPPSEPAAGPTDAVSSEIPAVSSLPAFQPAPPPVTVAAEPVAALPALRAPSPIDAQSAPVAPAPEGLTVGWHPDPRDANGGAVYWDGAQWTARRFWDGSAWVDGPY